MDDTHAMKERKPESRWGVVGSGGSNGDWLSIQDLQETPTTTTSVHLTPTSYNLGTPPPHPTLTTTTKRVSLGLLGQTVPIRAGLRACVWDIGHFLNWNQKGQTPSKSLSWKEMGEDAAFLLTDSQGLPVAHASSSLRLPEENERKA